MMKNTQSRLVAWFTIAMLLVVFGYIAAEQRGQPIADEPGFVEDAVANTDLPEQLISIGDTVLQVEVARTPREWVIGLSNRLKLSEGRGMLFVFDHDGDHAIWMKDMNFSIDIIWIDVNGVVVHTVDAVAPETYPKSFSSPIPARYVLEVPAGYAEGRIEAGDMVLFE